MIVLSGALVLVALVLLVFGALDRNLPYVYASIGVSVLSLLLLLVGILQRRGELTGEDQDAPQVVDTSDERVPALVGADQDRGRAEVGERDAAPSEPALPVAAPQLEQPASRRVAPVVEDEPDDVDEPEDEPLVDEPEAAPYEDELEDDELEDDRLEGDEAAPEGSGVTVLVVSGRPRYHLEGCRVLRGKEPEPLDRDDARRHGFSPCGVCKPDADERAADVPAPAPHADAEGAQAPEEGVSFAEALFGEPLFADAPAAAASPDRARESGEAEPAVAPASRRRRPAAEAAVPADELPLPAALHGEDPADEPVPAPDDVRAEPAPDVAGNPDELVEEPVVEAPVVDEPVVEEPVVDEPVVEEPVVEAPVVEEAVVDEPVVEEPVLEPVAAEDVPVGDTPPSPEEVSPAEPVDHEVGEPATASAPAEEAAAEVAADAEAPAKRAPAKKSPAKRAAAKGAATKAPAKAPAKRAPAKKAPAKTAAAAPAPEPAVKRPLVRTVRPDALRLGAPSAGGSTTRVSVRAAAPAAAPPVVVVPDRDRFHRPECRYVRGVAGATTLPKASASRQGYAACGVCKP